MAEHHPINEESTCHIESETSYDPHLELDVPVYACVGLDPPAKRTILCPLCEGKKCPLCGGTGRMELDEE